MCIFFFFNDTATTEIYTLSLHDALPIFDSDDADRARLGRTRSAIYLQPHGLWLVRPRLRPRVRRQQRLSGIGEDRKSTRLNSSHSQISYAVFCLKKKKITLCTRSR